MAARSSRRPLQRFPIGVPHYVVSALLLGIIVLAIAAALALIPDAERPTLQSPTPSSAPT